MAELVTVRADGRDHRPVTVDREIDGGILIDAIAEHRVVGIDSAVDHRDPYARTGRSPEGPLGRHVLRLGRARQSERDRVMSPRRALPIAHGAVPRRPRSSAATSR